MSNPEGVNRTILLVLRIAGAIGAALLLTLAYAVYKFEHPTEYAFPDHDLPGHLAGRWVWSSHRIACGDSAETISFSADRKTMTLAGLPSARNGKKGYTAVYDLSNITASSLRGAIRGEKRKTTEGEPVVWDLVMVGPDEYHWHRTDWRSYAFTQPISRCDTTVAEPKAHETH